MFTLPREALLVVESKLPETVTNKKSSILLLCFYIHFSQAKDLYEKRARSYSCPNCLNASEVDKTGNAFFVIISIIIIKFFTGGIIHN